MTTKRIALGDVGRAIITGFEGVVTAQVDYLTGCSQLCLQPQGLDEKGKPFESFYFDEPYVDLVSREAVVNRTPGRTEGATSAPGRSGDASPPH